MKTSPTKKKTVLVCGDLVWDTHIARVPLSSTGYSQPHLQSQLSTRYGGAWYLRDMIRRAIKAAKAEAKGKVAQRKADLARAQEATEEGPSPQTLASMHKQISEATKREEQFNAKVIAPKQASPKDIEDKTAQISGIAKAFSVWEWFAPVPKPGKAEIKNGAVKYKWSDGEAEPGAWRIKEFLGCQEPTWKDENGKLKSCPVIPIDTVPDVLVIDDLGLGFAEHEECWPAWLKKNPTELPSAILAKVKPPFDSPLWKLLLDPKKRWAAKLTLVVSASGLRAVGGLLGHGFSWDRTIQEVKAEFGRGGVCWPLRYCHSVVVTFGHSGAAVFSREPRSGDEAGKMAPTLQFERFVFDPKNLEGIWSRDLPGTTFGAVSVMTAALTARALAAPQPSNHLAVSRGLAAARELHRIGGGHDEDALVLRAADSTAFKTATESAPEACFRSAFPRDLLDDPLLVPKSQLEPLESQTLLTDVIGLTSAFLTVAAQDIVRSGKEPPLKAVPRLEYGDYFTVDREEIERLNTVRNLILDYLNNANDKRPLSLAVFGPPGSGKSFAIKALSAALFGKDRSALEFNLSQFEGLDALHQAFHEVRSKSVQGQIPLVFWDEFDSVRGLTALGWLKEFLAPMQDYQFIANGIAHPFGKCIFVFAGGTKSTFSEFIRPIDANYKPKGLVEKRAFPAELAYFTQVKGPDFVSRLRGYVNIKGPNPASENGDEVNVIRRALLLRSLIEKHHKNVIHPVTKELAIGPTVLDAFLNVEKYLHGARSMDAIVSLSRLGRSRYFGPSELPPREVVEVHVSPDFFRRVEDKTRYHLTPDDIERLAEMKHESWRAAKGKKKVVRGSDGRKRITEGYICGPVRDDEANPPTHPLMVDYAKLTEDQKGSNRFPARLMALRLKFLGYEIGSPGQIKGSVVTHTRRLPPREKLARSEHRRWMREKLLNGFAYATATSDDLLLHTDICKFDELSKRGEHLDYAIIDAVFCFLKEKNLVLVKRKEIKQAVKRRGQVAPAKKVTKRRKKA